MRRLRFTLLALSLVAGCASRDPVEGIAPKRERDVLTKEELIASTQSNVDLFQALRSLRPHFLLAPSGVRTPVAPTQVYIDRVRANGGLRVLTTIAVRAVERVEYWDPMRSESELGHSANGGSVMVWTIGGSADARSPDGHGSAARIH